MGQKRRAEPCGRCGWKYEGFHICFDASKPCPGEGQIVPALPRRKSGAKTAAGLASISRTQSDRWQQYREELRPRDEMIVERYKEGAGTRDLEHEFNLSHSTIVGVIRREEELTGETIMRPRGLNVRYIKEVRNGFQ